MCVYCNELFPGCFVIVHLAPIMLCCVCVYAMLLVLFSSPLLVCRVFMCLEAPVIIHAKQRLFLCKFLLVKRHSCGQIAGLLQYYSYCMHGM